MIGGTLTLGVTATIVTPENVMTIPAKYEKGVFRALQDVAIKDGTIVEGYVPAENEPARKRPSIRDLLFYGIWADRDDITDGVSYVNTLRNNPRG
jgi:hypothetical protein